MEDIEELTLERTQPQVDTQNKNIDNWVTKELRQSCTPQINGEITKGKLRWRGIQKVSSIDGIYIAQRGERISPIFVINKNK